MIIASVIAILCCFVVAALLFWFLSRRMNTDGSLKTEYDERQKVARGIGYKYGFFTLMACILIMIFFDILGISLPLSNTVMCFTSLIIAIIVLTYYCIMHDAYWGMNTNVKSYTILFIVVGAINLIDSFIVMIKGDMIVDGVVQYHFINFECGILFALIGIMLLTKKHRDKKEENEEREI